MTWKRVRRVDTEYAATCCNCAKGLKRGDRVWKFVNLWPVRYACSAKCEFEFRGRWLDEEARARGWWDAKYG